MVLSVTYDSGRSSGRLRTSVAVALLAAVLLAGCQARVARQPAPAQPAAEPSPAPVDTFNAPEVPAPSVALPPSDPNQAKVGLLLPLSGRHKAVGQAILNAAELALFDLADNDFNLLVRDTGGTAPGAKAAARSLLEEGVGLILGPLFASSVIAITPEVRPTGVPVVAFSNDRLVAGDGIFVMGLSPKAQVERVVGYAASQGLIDFGLLAPNTPYGNAVIKAMQGAMQRNGTQLSRLVTYPAGSSDLTPQVKSLAQYERRSGSLEAQKQQLAARGDEASRRALARLESRKTLGSLGLDALMIPVGGKSLLAIAPLLAFYDVDPAQVKFLGTTLWNDPRLGTEPSLQGGWFAAPSPRLWGNFRKRYQGAFGRPPPRIASLGYDSTALAAVLAQQPIDVATGRRFAADSLTVPSGFVGIDGIFRFLTNGEAQRGLAVLEMHRNELRVIDPAPQSFDQLIN